MRAFDTLWLLMPDSAMPAVLLATACLVLLGIVRPLSAAALALVILAAPLLESGIAGIVERLPWWVVLLTVTALACTVLRGVFALFLGREGASHLMALLAIGGFRLAGGLLASLARAIRWLFARLVVPRRAGAPGEVGAAVAVALVHRALLVGCLLFPGIVEAQAGRTMARGIAKGAVRSAEKRMAAVLVRDARRDAVTAITRLPAPRAVFRYVVPDAARAETRSGFSAGAHFSSAAVPGRPLSGVRAWQKYGLPKVPKVRESVVLPKGTSVRFNRALGGQRGVGEISIARPMPATAIERTVRLRK